MSKQSLCSRLLKRLCIISIISVGLCIAWCIVTLQGRVYADDTQGSTDSTNDSQISVLVFDDVVVITGVDFVTAPEVEEDEDLNIELLMGVLVHDGLYPSYYPKSTCVILRLNKSTRLECYQHSTDTENPERTRLSIHPKITTSRLTNLETKINEIDQKLAILLSGSVPVIPSGLKVNPNTATKEQLEDLPGIGEATARNIIEARNHVIFKKPEDLYIVKGLGEVKIEKIRPYLVFDDPE